MKGSFQIARFFGIPVEVHWTFGLIVLWILYVVYDKTGQFDPQMLFWQTLFVLSIFFCVMLHEFGHALTARKYGVKTLDIILSPIGGVARLDRMPEKPLQEFWVALAGPLVNVGIILLLSVYVLLQGDIKKSQFLDLLYLVVNPQSNTFAAGLSQFDYYVVGLIGLNAALALFNLLPAFPLDGGRIFRALLSMRLNRLQATRIAARTGQLLAIVLGLYGIANGNIITAMIGVFVFSTAAGEYNYVKMEDALSRTTVNDLVRTSYTLVPDSWHIPEMLQLIPHGLEKYFIVWDEYQDKPTGWVSDKMLFEANKNASLNDLTEIADIQNTTLVEVQSSDSLHGAFNVMRTHQVPILLVKKEDELIGVLDMGMVDQFIRMTRSLK